MGLLTQFEWITGACGNCASSETTMKMGIERVLKEKFGDAVQDIRQLSFEEPKETTVEASPILQYPFFIFSFLCWICLIIVIVI